MQRLVVCVAVLFVAVNVHAGHKEEAMEAFNKCKEEVGAKDEDVAPLINKKPPVTREAKCVVACMMEKSGVFKDGKYVSEKGEDMIKKFMKDEPEKQGLAKNAADECGKQVEAAKLEKCEAAVKLASCFKDKFGESGEN